ncbi:MAG: hypothetical protein GC203_21705 [Phenylobacterium sp.]|uniref:hypothetical protein n=1 Tax=Phenylobacterium sp. TaxID=1871053 RepID=UPI0025D92454|nr:hypothetical protein [Phenylobacterium sp.]MBI1200485.1 hypothetical protein [Phenylobacterium sp.]
MNADIGHIDGGGAESRTARTVFMGGPDKPGHDDPKYLQAVGWTPPLERDPQKWNAVLRSDRAQTFDLEPFPFK